MILKRLSKMTEGHLCAMASEIIDINTTPALLIWLIFIDDNHDVVASIYYENGGNKSYYKGRIEEWTRWAKRQKFKGIIAHGWEKSFSVSELGFSDFMRCFAIARPNASITVLKED